MGNGHRYRIFFVLGGRGETRICNFVVLIVVIAEIVTTFYVCNSISSV